jgi:hypothetical protein
MRDSRPSLGIAKEHRFAELMSAREQTTPCFALHLKLLSVNAKQLEQPVFQAGPSRCESDHGCQLSA